MSAHDRRLHAFRPDLADERLRGKVEAERFVPGRLARIVVPVADLRTAPRPDSGLSSQLLYGDDVRVFEEREGWAWVQAVRDDYVGYVADKVLGPAVDAVTHVVGAPRTFVYPGPDMKLPRSGELSSSDLGGPIMPPVNNEPIQRAPALSMAMASERKT